MWLLRWSPYLLHFEVICYLLTVFETLCQSYKIFNNGRISQRTFANVFIHMWIRFTNSSSFQRAQMKCIDYTCILQDPLSWTCSSCWAETRKPVLGSVRHAVKSLLQFLTQLRIHDFCIIFCVLLNPNAAKQLKRTEWTIFFSFLKDLQGNSLITKKGDKNEERIMTLLCIIYNAQ